MLRKILLAGLILVAAALTAAADEATSTLVSSAWPPDPTARVSDFGRGVGIVFSPDLSVPGNCRFYQALGFACFQDSDWNRVLTGIRENNIFHPENRIRTLILETHGTNGNGLKLQKSYDPAADRSYVSIGALQERLDPDGVRYIVVSACNSGRLLRPAIYRTLDPHPGDKLFLPATRGIINASADFDPQRSNVTIITPASSHIETSLAATVHELAPVTRSVLARSAKARGIAAPKAFAVSDIFMEIVLHDPRLRLTTSGEADELSRDIQPVDVSESLFSSFINHVNALAAREAPSMPKTPAAARHISPRKKLPSGTAGRAVAAARP
jgi:hypothetical protein